MLEIVAASVQDVELLHRLGNQTFRDTYRDILSAQQIDYMCDMMYTVESLSQQITHLGHQYFIVYIDGVPSGYLSIEDEGEGLYHLQKIYLLSSARSKGVGRELISYAFDYVRSICKFPKCRVELNVNRENSALSFYQKMGMHIARSGDFDIGGGYFMNDHIMAIEL